MINPSHHFPVTRGKAHGSFRRWECPYGLSEVRVSMANYGKKIASVQVVVKPDEYPDVSYLEQDFEKERLAQYNNGEFYFVGIYAVAEVLTPCGIDSGNNTCYIINHIRSGGLYGIESDIDEDYKKEVQQQELSVLSDILKQFGFDEQEIEEKTSHATVKEV